MTRYLKQYLKEAFESYQRAMIYIVLLDHPGLWNPNDLIITKNEPKENENNDY